MPKEADKNDDSNCRQCGERHEAGESACAKEANSEKQALKIGAYTAQLCSFCGQKHRGGKEVCQGKDDDETPVLPGRKHRSSGEAASGKPEDTPLTPGRRPRSRKHKHKQHDDTTDDTGESEETSDEENQVSGNSALPQAQFNRSSARQSRARPRLSIGDEPDEHDDADAPSTVRAQLAQPETSSTPEDLIGHTLSSRYALLELIGKGGMSAVYKAKDLKLNKPLAIKVLLPHLMGNALSQQRFQVEAQAASSLSHPNLIQTIDFGFMLDGSPYIVMELLEGQSLAELLKEKKRLPLDRAVPIFIQICDALSHAHAKGIFHRDLKPSNVMITVTSGVDFVRILDFGIAKVVPAEGAESLGLTRTGEVFGSPNYMSPEQCSGTKIDGRSDVYSMGCLMYEVLTGQVPLVGENIMDTLLKQMNETPPDFRTVDANLNIPHQMELIVFKALAKNPAERYPSTEALGEALRAFQQNVTVLLLKHIQDRWQMLKLKVSPLKKREKALVALALIASLLFVGIATKYLSSYFEMTTQSTFPADKAFMPMPVPRPPTTPPNHEMVMSGLRSQESKLRSDPNSDRYINYLHSVESIASNYVTANYYKEAAVCYHKLLELYLQNDGSKSVSTHDVMEKLADCDFKLGQYKEAAEYYETLLKDSRNKDAQATNHHLDLRVKKATSLYALGNYSEALPEFKRIVTQLSQNDQFPAEDLAITCARTAECYRMRSLWNEAIQQYEASAEAYKQLLKEGGYFSSNNVSDTRNTLVNFYRAYCLYKLDKLESAGKAYKAAIPQLKKLTGPGRDLTVPAMMQYADILWRQGNIAEALNMRMKAREFLNMYSE